MVEVILEFLNSLLSYIFQMINVVLDSLVFLTLLFFVLAFVIMIFRYIAEKTRGLAQ